MSGSVGLSGWEELEAKAHAASTVFTGCAGGPRASFRTRQQAPHVQRYSYLSALGVRGPCAMGDGHMLLGPRKHQAK